METTIPSYLTAWLSRDLVMAGHQQTTCEWWEKRRHDFDLFISQLVVDEAGGGDADAARRRLELLADLPILDSGREVIALSGELMKHAKLPPRAKADSFHIAIAAANGMDFLLTWNCTHIANAENRAGIEKACRAGGFEPPVICTPEELL